MAESNTLAGKRRASPSFDMDRDTANYKRHRTNSTDPSTAASSAANSNVTTTSSVALLEDLAQELQCGCCSELVYKPVAVSPCQHFFCGSCSSLWIKNGGSTCPSCRRESTYASPSCIVQTMVDVLLRSAPQMARAENERRQADEIYTGSSLRFPPPKEPSPEPDLNRSTEFCTPCPHCLLDNQFGWTCPLPVPDPLTSDTPWPLEDGPPPGHSMCGNCENLLAIAAPHTSKCDLCSTLYCGIGIPDRCIADRIHHQVPQDLLRVGDLIESPEIYDFFDGNAVEPEMMFDYMNELGITPVSIYRDIIRHVQKHPAAFESFMKENSFEPPSNVPEPSSSVAPPLPSLQPRALKRICRPCAADILLWGLRDWWVREVEKGLPNMSVRKRPPCSEGRACSQQKDLAHAKEYDHLLAGVAEVHVPSDNGLSSPETFKTIIPSTSAEEETDRIIATLEERLRDAVAAATASIEEDF